jgi:uncharacterized RDD family membrane protein YckC
MAAGTTMRYQGVLVRLAAPLVDGVLITLVSEALFARIFKSAPFRAGDAPRPGFSLFAAAILLVYLIAMEATFGATLGKMALRIRVVTEDGQPIGFA